jgi:hypothetical protein
MCCNGRTRPLRKAVFFSRLRGSRLVAPSYIRQKMRETWRLLRGPLYHLLCCRLSSFLPFSRRAYSTTSPTAALLLSRKSMLPGRSTRRLDRERPRPMSKLLLGEPDRATTAATTSAKATETSIIAVPPREASIL